MWKLIYYDPEIGPKLLALGEGVVKEGIPKKYDFWSIEYVFKTYKFQQLYIWFEVVVHFN